MCQDTNPTYEKQRQLIKQWDATEREFASMRRKALRDMPYRREDMNILLSMGDEFAHAFPRAASGHVEMQYWFMKARRES